MTSYPTLPAYTGKTIVYIDQNVLDVAIKGDLPAFFTSIMHRYQNRSG